MFKQMFVLELSFQYLLFSTFLRCFSSEKTQNCRHGSLTTMHLEPETLNVFTMSANSRAALCLNYFMTGAVTFIQS